jgi:hypothetical protein
MVRKDTRDRHELAVRGEARRGGRGMLWRRDEAPAASVARGRRVGCDDDVRGAGGGRGGGPEEIKAAYRRVARWWHPDACPGGADRFMLAREAYELLSDTEHHRGYDIQLRCGGGDAGRRAFRRVGFVDWEVQLAGLQWHAAERETWGARMRNRTAQPMW